MGCFYLQALHKHPILGALVQFAVLVLLTSNFHLVLSIIRHDIKEEPAKNPLSATIPYGDSWLSRASIPSSCS